jgi:nucleoside-triphosphatase
VSNSASGGDQAGEKVKTVYLLTGSPGSGKTSLIKQCLAGIPARAGGFYTEEIRERGTRLGFKLVTLDGLEAVLAHIDFKKPPRVGKYGVDVAALERVGVTALRRASRDGDLIVIDEIGRMELLSGEFRNTVMEITGGGGKVLGTIMLQPNPFADAVKRQAQVILATLTRQDYQETLGNVRRWLQSIALTDIAAPGFQLSLE